MVGSRRIFVEHRFYQRPYLVEFLHTATGLLPNGGGPSFSHDKYMAVMHDGVPWEISSPRLWPMIK